MTSIGPDWDYEDYKYEHKYSSQRTTCANCGLVDNYSKYDITLCRQCRKLTTQVQNQPAPKPIPVFAITVRPIEID